MDLPFDLQSIPCRTGIKDYFKSMTVQALGEQIHSAEFTVRAALAALFILQSSTAALVQTQKK